MTTLLDKALPALQRVLELKVRHNGTLMVEDEHGMVVFSPVEAGVMRQVLPRFHTFCLLSLHRGAVGRRSDTGSLAGYCSLRR